MVARLFKPTPHRFGFEYLSDAQQVRIVRLSANHIAILYPMAQIG